MSLLLLFIHGWHPSIKRSTIIFFCGWKYSWIKWFYPWMRFSDPLAKWLFPWTKSCHSWIYLSCFWVKIEKKSILPRAICMKFLTWKYDTFNFHTKTWQIKIPFMDKKIYPCTKFYLSKSSLDWKISSMHKIILSMDDFDR